MRAFLLLIGLVINSGWALSQPEFDFSKRVIKLPKTAEGQVVEFSFEFTNSGNEPLLISEVKVQCSCTKVDFPNKPVLPGEKGKLKVSFDTKGKIGYQDRTLEIHYNHPKSPEIVRFKIMIDNKAEKK